MPEPLLRASTFKAPSKDPVAFFEGALGWKPWWKQAEIARAVHAAMEQRGRPWVAVRSGNGVGKTALAARLMLWALRCYEDAIVITTAPTQRQVEHLLWREARAAYYAAHAPSEPYQPLLGGQMYAGEPRWDLAPKRYALGLSPEKTRPERFQGFHARHVLFIVDEASGIPEAHWQAIKGGSSAGTAVILAIGNPTRNSGDFYDAFHRSRHLYSLHHISALDLPGNANALDVTEDQAPAREVPSTPVPSPVLSSRAPAIEAAARDLGAGSGRIKATSQDLRNAEPSSSSNPPPSVTGAAPVIAREGPEPSSAEADEATSRGTPSLNAHEPTSSPSNPPLPALVSPSGIRQAAADWGTDSPLFQVRILGNFPSLSETGLFSMDWAEFCASPEARRLPGHWALGVDVARFGSNETVFALLYGNTLVSLETHRGWDTYRTAERIQTLYQDIRAGRLLPPPEMPLPEPKPQDDDSNYRSSALVPLSPRLTAAFGSAGIYLSTFRSARTPVPPPPPTHSRDIRILVDDGGVGGGVVDICRRLNVSVTPVIAGSKPSEGSHPELFRDKLAQYYWALREALSKGELVLLRDDLLFSQLIQIEWEYAADRQIRVHKKGLDKSQHSPDRADALALAWEARRQSTRSLGLW